MGLSIFLVVTFWLTAVPENSREARLRAARGSGDSIAAGRVRPDQWLGVGGLVIGEGVGCKI